jgi:hypothetical protein
MSLVRSLVVLGLLVSSSAAFAQDKKDASQQDLSAPTTDDSGQKVQYKTKTEIDFDQIDVNGQLVKPEGQLLLERKKASFNPLIRFREDFNTEMKQSIDEVK